MVEVDLQKMDACLEQKDWERRANRDKWAEMFESLRADFLCDLVDDQQSQELVLRFLNCLPSVSPVHRSQADTLLKKLMVHAEWMVAAKRLHGHLDEGPLKDKLNDLHRRSCCSCVWGGCCHGSLSLVLATLLCVASVFLSFHLWPSWHHDLETVGTEVKSNELPGFRNCFVVLSVPVALFMASLMMANFLLVAFRCLHWSAALAVLLGIAGLVSLLGAATWLILSHFYFLDHLIPKHLAIACLIPWYIKTAFTWHSALSTAVMSFEWLNSAFSRCMPCVFNFSRLYPRSTLQKPLLITTRMISQTGAVPKLVGDPADTDVTYWADQLLQKIAKDACFDDSAHIDVIRAMNEDVKANICDVCRFHFWYVPCLSRVAYSFVCRSLWLAEAKRCIRKEAHKHEEERVSWQLLTDQYDWYSKNGYCFCDILAMMLQRDKYAGRAFWYLHAIDEILGCWLTLFCQQRLWVPSAEQRQADLWMRLQIVQQLANGCTVLTAPPGRSQFTRSATSSA